MRSHRLLLVALALLLLPVLTAGPSAAQRLGPGHVSMPGFSGYVTRAGGELGVGRLADGTLGVCLDTGPGLRWPAGTPAHRLVGSPRAAYLLSTYLPRARRDGRLAAALWWAVGGSLGLNSHPDEVRSHVAGLRAEAPQVYAAVLRWHRRMLSAARRDAPGARGYTTGLRLHRTGASTAQVGGIGVRSGSGHWVAGHRVRLTVTGARFADGRRTWTGTSGAATRTLRLRTLPDRPVRLTEAIGGLSRPVFRLYDAGGSTQRVATSAGATTARATARLARPPHPTVPLRLVKTAEGGDPAGLIGVAVAVHAGSRQGPVVARHTFTPGDVSGGTASYTFPRRYDATRRYLATVTAEPAGWIPETATVPATASGRTLVARLVDDRVWQPTLATRASAQSVRVGATLHDSVTVADTGGDRLTGGWRLLGPVPPGHAGCAGRSWASAPLAAEGDFTVAGDGTYDVGTHRVSAPGCYTYVERLGGDRTTREVPWTTTGAATETTLVRSVPRLATQTSPQRGTAGATLVDQVRVTGLGTARATGVWQLLGPLAPNRRLRCTGLAWGGAPVAGRGTFRVHGDGTVVAGRARVRRGGCYTYRERLAATTQSTAVAWTRPGTGTETIVVRPRQPRVPAHPTVPAGGGRPAAARRAVGSVSLAATGLHAALSEVSFRGPALTPPGDIATAGLWRDGAMLDDVVGTTVLVGHVSDDHDRPGAFHRLAGAHHGQTVVTVAGGARTRWRITRITMTAKRELPRSVFRQGLARRLVLVTCGNEVHYPDGGFHYRSNLVIEAVPR